MNEDGMSSYFWLSSNKTKVRKGFDKLNLFTEDCDMLGVPSRNSANMYNTYRHKNNKTNPHWINKTNVHDLTLYAEISTDQCLNISAGTTR